MDINFKFGLYNPDLETLIFCFLQKKEKKKVWQSTPAADHHQIEKNLIRFKCDSTVAFAQTQHFTPLRAENICCLLPNLFL